MRTKILILIPTILVAAGIVLFITFAAVQNGAWAKIFPGQAETADSVSSIQNTENTRDAGSTQNTESTQSTENGRNTGNNGSVASGEMQNASRPAESAGSEEKEDAAEKTVYLTFDDGPSEMTPLILDILEDYQVRATFFVTGINPGCAGYIRDAYEAGHTIGMHTYSHDYAEIYSSVRAYYDDLERISQVCRDQIGYVPRCIRFPGGSSNTVSAKYSPGIMTYLTEDVTERGYLYCDWNCANGDGEGSLSVPELVENASEGAQYRQAVMLCHDGNGKRATVDALPQIIEYFRSQGYVFRPLTEDTQMPRHQVKN